jgi:ferrous iron transport protein A
MKQILESPSPLSPLSGLSAGVSGHISRIDAPELEVALLKMGISIGDRCKISGIAPFGDPIAIRVDRTQISLRKCDARHIWIQPQA